MFGLLALTFLAGCIVGAAVIDLARWQRQRSAARTFCAPWTRARYTTVTAASRCPSTRSPRTPVTQPLLILIAGPYCSGTHDDPERIAANVRAMTGMALRVFRAGTCRSWASGWRCRSSSRPGRRLSATRSSTIFHPIARRLVQRCDACLRIGGPSQGADEMVALARAAGRLAFTDFQQLPRIDRAWP